MRTWVVEKKPMGAETTSKHMLFGRSRSPKGRFPECEVPQPFVICRCPRLLVGWPLEIVIVQLYDESGDPPRAGKATHHPHVSQYRMMKLKEPQFISFSNNAAAKLEYILMQVPAVVVYHITARMFPVAFKTVFFKPCGAELCTRVFGAPLIRFSGSCGNDTCDQAGSCAGRCMQE